MPRPGFLLLLFLASTHPLSTGLSSGSVVVPWNRSPSAAPSPILSTPPAATSSAPRAAALADLRGSGPGAVKLACLACAGLVLGMGGTSILGVALTVMLYPDLVTVCGAGCVLALL